MCSIEQNGVREFEVPKSAMVIVAHPDDIEFNVAGTIAMWVNKGCFVIYVICTDGNIGSYEPNMTSNKLSQIRRSEQYAAASELGIDTVEFLGYPDGQLLPTLGLRRDIVRLIRQYKPEIVMCQAPTAIFLGDEYINHPDHRAAAQAALDAIAPASAMPMLWSELGPSHSVRQVYIFNSSKPNLWIDITDTIEKKITALKKHASQMANYDPSEEIKRWGVEAGKAKGLNYAESYRVITLL
jgi:LmbE family N-acetylglucosaminyl deacetylase